MHNIRRKAKYQAWYSDPNEEPSGFPIRNPFGKYRASTNSRTNTLDSQEKGHEGLSKVVSDNYSGNQAAQSRRHEVRGQSPPARGDTVPSSHSRLNHRSRMDSDIAPRSDSPIAEDHEHASREYDEKAGKDSQSSDTVAAEEEKSAHGMKDRMNDLIHRKDHDKGKETEVNGEINGDNNNGKEKPEKKKFTLMSQIRGTIFNSWINVLLVFSPVGIAVHYAHVNPIAVFVINFVAIIPLAAMLSYATEEIALRTGETIGGLLNASFGNAVELIVSIIALTQDQFLIVQTSLIGSILSNLLLVMGMCFFFGGFNRIEQAFNMTVAQTASSLLFLAVSALILPTAFSSFASETSQLKASGVKALSDGTAVMLLLVYGAYLFFQLKSHAAMYNKPSDKNQKRDLRKHTDKFKNKMRMKKNRYPPVGTEVESRRESRGSDEEQAEDVPEEPQLSVTTAIITLIASTVLVALNAEYLVDSINAITCGSNGISKNFVGLILLPIVGNAAEHATAVTVAVKDKMDLAIGVAVGSSMQIALLVLPFVVVLGWIMGKDMTLYFDPFQVIVLFVAVLLVNYLIQDGKSHWLEGVLLQTLYIVIAVAAWFYPAAASEC